MERADTATAYEAALDALYALINFERQRMDRYTESKLDPERSQKLVDHLGAPQTQFPAIHIAGTKGKGSVAALCAYSLRAAGLRVGLYTSPHLQEFRERIRILTPDDADGRICQADFVDRMAEVQAALDQVAGVTWFEAVTAVALLHFAHQQVDIAVIETGLGGRLDATRVVHPLVCVITSLSLDHTELLGNTLAEIAYEKAGIIKPGVPVVCAPQAPEAESRLREIAAERGSPIQFIGQPAVGEGLVPVSPAHQGQPQGLPVQDVAGWRYSGIPGRPQQLLIEQSLDPAFIPPGSVFPLALRGDHQIENGMVALAALGLIRDRFPQVEETAVRLGLGGVEWNGRLQTVHPGDSQTPALLLDCAHNPDSVARLCHALTRDYHYQRLLLIFGAPADKDTASMLSQLVPLTQIIFTTSANHPRSASPEDLAAQVQALGGQAIITVDLAEALTRAWALAEPGDLICATGSIIVVGDLLNQWESLQSQLTVNSQ
jgi:dihydrofolate synthase / folylpolyglutamate synthase